MNLCELVRRRERADRLFCLYPYREYSGLHQACTIAYDPVTIINLRFFEPWIQVWVGEHEIRYQPGNTYEECFSLQDFSFNLWKVNKEIGIWFVYSLFLNALRYFRKCVASDAASDAAYAYSEMKKAFKSLIKFRKLEDED